LAKLTSLGQVGKMSPQKKQCKCEEVNTSQKLDSDNPLTIPSMGV